MPSNTHVFLADWLVDGQSADVLKKVLVSVRDGSIVDISSSDHRDISGKGPVVDLSGCGLLPAFTDCHVHLCLSGTIDPRLRSKQPASSADEIGQTIAEHLRQSFTHGLLGLRDAGDRFASYSRYGRHAGGRHEPLPVRVESAGAGFYKNGSYGSFLGQPYDHRKIPAALAKMAGGQRFVKIINSGMNSLERFGDYQDSLFQPAELADVITQATAKDLRVMVHANGPSAVKAAIEGGCTSIEHGYFMGRDNLKRMADAGTYWVPTIYAMKACAENFACMAGSGAKKAVIEKNVEAQLAQLAMARELGVKIAVGTDAGSFGVLHGEAFAEELNLYKKAGFSLAEIVRCGAGAGASLAGFHTIGTLAPGTAATFLVVRGVPAQMPRKFGYLENIYIDGQPSAHYLKQYRQIDYLRATERP